MAASPSDAGGTLPHRSSNNLPPEETPKIVLASFDATVGSTVFDAPGITCLGRREGVAREDSPRGCAVIYTTGDRLIVLGKYGDGLLVGSPRTDQWGLVPQQSVDVNLDEGQFEPEKAEWSRDYGAALTYLLRENIQGSPQPPPKELNTSDANINDKIVAWEDLTVIGEIGRGNMGQVREAEYSGVPVALKVMEGGDARQMETLKQEALILSKLSHPNCVQYIGFTTNPNTFECAIVMERLEESLDTFLHDESRPFITPRMRASLVLKICHGLMYVHKRIGPHRDLKPKNVLVAHRGSVVKIADFGISGTGNAIGGYTPRYAAPEVLMGGHGDILADSYSLGVVAFEIFTLDVPFKDMEMRLTNMTIAPGSCGHPQQTTLVNRLCAFDPPRRISVAAAAEQALALLRSYATDDASAPSGLAGPQPQRRAQTQQERPHRVRVHESAPAHVPDRRHKPRPHAGEETIESGSDSDGERRREREKQAVKGQVTSAPAIGGADKTAAVVSRTGAGAGAGAAVYNTTLLTTGAINTNPTTDALASGVMKTSPSTKPKKKTIKKNSGTPDTGSPSSTGPAPADHAKSCLPEGTKRDGVAILAHVAASDSEVSLAVGDRVSEIAETVGTREELEDGRFWVKGTNSEGKRGYFLAASVRLNNDPAGATEASTTGRGKFIARRDNTEDLHGEELRFVKGDEIVLMYRTLNDGWGYGCVCGERCGVFPYKYTKVFT